MKISGTQKGESRSRFLRGPLCTAVVLSLIMILPAGAFIVLGFLVALMNFLETRKKSLTASR